MIKHFRVDCCRYAIAVISCTVGLSFSIIKHIFDIYKNLYFVIDIIAYNNTYRLKFWCNGKILPEGQTSSDQTCTYKTNSNNTNVIVQTNLLLSLRSTCCAAYTWIWGCFILPGSFKGLWSFKHVYVCFIIYIEHYRIICQCRLKCNVTFNISQLCLLCLTTLASWLLLFSVFCSRKLKFLITGGCGYFAFELAKSLCNLGAAVTLLDIHLPVRIEKHLSDHLKFIKVTHPNNLCIYCMCVCMCVCGYAVHYRCS